MAHFSKCSKYLSQTPIIAPLALLMVPISSKFNLPRKSSGMIAKGKVLGRVKLASCLTAQKRKDWEILHLRM
jgi:hypothetical protein